MEDGSVEHRFLLCGKIAIELYEIFQIVFEACVSPMQASVAAMETIGGLQLTFSPHRKKLVLA